MRSSRRSNLPILLFLAMLVSSTHVLAGLSEVEAGVASEHKQSVTPASSVQPMAAGTTTPIVISGEWTAAGLTIPRMIVRDLIFYVSSDTSPPCSFSMGYVISSTSSRTIRRFDLAVADSVQHRFSAGIDTNNLRFGTIGVGTCLRHWVAMGESLPDFLFADGFESPP